VAGWVVVVSATVWAACLLLLDPELGKHVSNLGLVTVPLVAGAASLWRARGCEGPARRFWRLLGAGVLSWSAGQVVWTWYESVLHRVVPVPSPADVGYLGLPLLAAVALLSLSVAAPTRAGRARSILDGMLVASSLLLVSGLLVLEPVITEGLKSESARLELVTTLAYPVLDVVLITLVVYTWLQARQRPGYAEVSLPLVATGLVAFSISDSGFILLQSSDSYVSGNLIDVGWFVGFGLLLLAALRDDAPAAQADAAGPVVVKLRGSLLPYAAIAAALVTSAVHMAHSDFHGKFPFWSLLCLVVLLVARQVLSLAENLSLTRHLERRVESRTAELRASQQRFESLVQHSSDLVTVVDRAGTVLYQSRSSERVLGYSAEWLTGRSLLEVVERGAAAELLLALVRTPADIAGAHTVRSTWLHASGRPCQVEVTITNLLDTPEVGGLVLNARDITDRVALEEQLTRQAFIDSLTGLPNRALFRTRLQKALDSRTDHCAPPLTVFFLDLDGFKAINDTLGHSAGDVLLVDVAERLRSVVRSVDTVARFGGDEFAVLLENGHDEGYGPTLAQRIVDRMKAPFTVGTEEVYVTVSIGIAELDDPAAGAEQLLRNADLAMYQAKGTRAGSYSVYHPGMHAGLVERVRMEGDLRKAMEGQQFFLQYQPIVDMRTGQIRAVEALVRWQHPDRGIVPPNDFIPLAEATGVIRPLGLWVLREACAQTVRWRTSIPGAEDLRVSVNLSGQQLLQPDLVEQVARVLVETGLPADRLVLEMTESVLIDNSEQTLGVLVALRGMGIRLALDDFGTGFSSLSYLHRFPIDTLKIDRSFIERLSGDGDAALVDTILALAESLDMETVAEGIEDTHQSAVLQRQGCTSGQGYLFSPPVVPSAIEALLREQRWTVPTPTGAPVLVSISA
jgi:diguanylate cyclase (GGDEF)-like protein/PAS domain S-box-containing protein